MKVDKHRLNVPVCDQKFHEIKGYFDLDFQKDGQELSANIFFSIQ